MKVSAPVTIHAARAGYAARGVVYLLLAYFAMLAALGQGRIHDMHGALSELLGAPQGRVPLVVLIAGLLLFTLWRLIQSIGDVDRHGWSPKGCTVRLSLLVSAALYGSLAVWAIKLSLGSAEEATSAVQWTAKAMAQPWGRWLVAIAAAVLAAVGVAHFIKAVRRGFLRYLSSAARRAWIIRVSQIGLVSRGIMFILFGFFALRAAWRSDPGESKDLSTLLHWLHSLPYASVWIALAAIGLAAFGLYSVLEGIFRAPSRPSNLSAGHP